MFCRLSLVLIALVTISSANAAVQSRCPLCLDELSKKIETRGLEVLSEDDQHFVKRVDDLRRTDPLSLKHAELDRYDDLEDRVRKAGVNRLTQAERKAWKYWTTSTSYGQN
jgi:hypothetical protein